MASKQGTKIGFVSPAKSWGKHYDEFKALMPDGVDGDINPLGLYGTSLDELAGKLDEHVQRTSAMASGRGWKGIALMGAPMEVQNPGFVSRVREAVNIPVTTALASGAAGLRALGARKALLLTPFDNRLKGMIEEHLVGEGIEAILPTDSFEEIGHSPDQTPEKVFDIAREQFAQAPGAQAIYFQGGPFNPIQVIERMEAEFGIPVIASNPTMLWYITSILGLSFTVEGKGRLMREWPTPVAP
jgi:maleate isomerase